MELYISGSFEAFNVLYERYANKSYQYFAKKTQNNEDANELIQLLFLKMHSSKHLFQNKYKFEQWLFVIARTVFIDFYRRNKKFSYHEPLSDNEFQYFQEPSTFNADKNEVEHLDALSEKEKEILKLRYEDELSFKEISELLSQSEVSLRKFVSRTISKIKAKHGFSNGVSK